MKNELTCEWCGRFLYNNEEHKCEFKDDLFVQHILDKKSVFTCECGVDISNRRYIGKNRCQKCEDELAIQAKTDWLNKRKGLTFKQRLESLESLIYDNIKNLK